MWGEEHRSPFHTYRLVLFLSVSWSLKYILQHCYKPPSCICLCVFWRVHVWPYECLCVWGGEMWMTVRETGIQCFLCWSVSVHVKVSKVMCVCSPAHSGFSSSKFTAKSCETCSQEREQGRKERERGFFNSCDKPITQHSVSGPVYRFHAHFWLSCWSKASGTAKRGLKFNLNHPELPLLHQANMCATLVSYLEIRWYQSSETKRREHFITSGKKETWITKNIGREKYMHNVKHLYNRQFVK